MAPDALKLMKATNSNFLWREEFPEGLNGFSGAHSMVEKLNQALGYMVTLRDIKPFLLGPDPIFKIDL